ncbi:H(+)/Cl(-) exchange transporter 6-like isoform X2 [Ostrea edulis]|uniref:H(+)/Cl(-) exchange transporter 6-like isoform X2 n=1 Tax=Ostrea edulis TaxID=37623 RepID=UPI0024AF6B54|nr:H(+)/Cl(-) exchange transporter 6-like isoform X2 [Ostrea edulis]
MTEEDLFCDCSCCVWPHRQGPEELHGTETEPRSEEMRPLLRNRHSATNDYLPRKDFESLDYDRCFNKPYEEYLRNSEENKSSTKIEVIKWIVTFMIGFLTGMVALFIDLIVNLLSSVKFSVVDDSISQCSKDGCLVLSLLYLLLFNVGFTIIASFLVVTEPVAGGSGIPEIKCYLNGVKIPRVGRLMTLVSKAVGVLFSVAGGLFVGKEGPMIHSGAIIGAGVPQFQSIALRKINIKKYSFFRSDRDKRDFVSSGAAAGVAAAFGAPIGGVLFSLEEGCSFWNQKLTWRSFFCSMAATYSLNFFLSGVNTGNWGYFYLPGLINFGVFKCANESGIGCHLWNAVDLIVFIFMGLLGGVFGALFNTINLLLTQHRMKHVQKKHKFIRILEAILVAALTSTVSFSAAMLLGECRVMSSSQENGTTPLIDESVRTYFCPDGQYNDMATLFFNSQEEAIKQLFHQEGKFSLATLGLFFVFFFILSCWTYGVHVPSGLFVPSLLCGAAYGRFVATVLVKIGYANHENSGTFALIGAAAFLGGVVRMTISLTVILIESTNEISYGLPLMLVLMVAKWSGDYFNEGLYDIHIKLKGVPLLEWEVHHGTERLKAHDVMDESLSYVFTVSRVSSLIRMLRTTAHNAFPVVSRVERISINEEHAGSTEDTNEDVQESEDGILTAQKWRFKGLIMRHTLVTLLDRDVYFQEQNGNTSQPKIPYEDLTKDYPRYPDIHDVTKLSSAPEDALMDISGYMNPCPYTVFPNTPVPQVFNLFRSMGLRHLPVVDHMGLSPNSRGGNKNFRFLDQKCLLPNLVLKIYL